jgi:hypothetical protein
MRGITRPAIVTNLTHLWLHEQVRPTISSHHFAEQALDYLGAGRIAAIRRAVAKLIIHCSEPPQQQKARGSRHWLRIKRLSAARHLKSGFNWANQQYCSVPT